MAHNTKVAADTNAPPITRILAEFVARHPSGGFPRGGRARGASHVHKLARLRDRRGEPPDRRRPRWRPCRSWRLRRRRPCSVARERVDMASAALVNGIASHTFDFDDTHLKTIIHPAGPVASAALALAEHNGASGREVDRRAGPRHRRRLPRRQHDLSRSLRPRLAHHRLHRHARRRGRLRAPAAARRRAHDDGARHRRVAAGRRPRAVRLDDQAVPSRRRGARRTDVGAAGEATASRRRARGASRRRAASCRPYSAKCAWHEVTDDLGERFEISFNTYKPFACGIVIHPSIDGCVQLRDAHRLRAGRDREHRPARALARAGTHGQEGRRRTGLQGKFSVFHGCAAGFLFGQRRRGRVLGR